MVDAQPVSNAAEIGANKTLLNEIIINSAPRHYSGNYSVPKDLAQPAHDVCIREFSGDNASALPRLLWGP